MEMHQIRCLLASLAIALGATAACAETLDIKGVTRTFITQFPDTKPAPLVIVLHGNTQSGADVMARTSWPAVARRMPAASPPTPAPTTTTSTTALRR